MKYIIYKKTGEVNKETKGFPMIMHRSRERNKILYIGNAPVEVTDNEYKNLKASKHSKDILLVTNKTKLSTPMSHAIGESKKRGAKRQVEHEDEVKRAKEMIEGTERNLKNIKEVKKPEIKKGIKEKIKDVVKKVKKSKGSKRKSKKK